MKQARHSVRKQSSKVMRRYIIEYKDGSIEVYAKNRDYAFAKFFKDVADDKIRIDQLGNIVILKQKHGGPNNEFPFRTVPLLWQMKLISTDLAVSNIMATTNVNKKEAEKMLTTLSFKDAHLIPFIEELRRNQNC